jgi:hypothetical protein
MFRGIGLFLLHTLLAVLGPTLLGDPVNRFARPHSALDVVLRAWIGGILCAALTAIFMYRPLRSHTALWVWILPGIWLLFGILVFSTSSHDSVLADKLLTHFSGGTCASSLDHRPCWDFFAFTVPFVRAFSYSAGSLVSLRFSKGQPPRTGIHVRAEDVGA